jgi:hypothetical protein
MHDFLNRELRPALAHALARCPDFGPLPEALRMLSPSDFGPHNALIRRNGEVFFLDFEYFGQDDPVKLAADISLHPGTDLAVEQRVFLVETLLVTCEQAGDRYVRERFQAFWPLWRLKWCCILLNEFIPGEDARRIFAGADGNHEARLRIQLDKSKKMMYSEIL